MSFPFPHPDGPWQHLGRREIAAAAAPPYLHGRLGLSEACDALMR
ncbi:hypothetical protein [Noviherbaspirillum soli]|nr:hypothetical protein [Noviherbaspirillum soli]